MLNPDNKYTKMQKKFYGKDRALAMASTDHGHHNNNPDYWNILLEAVKGHSGNWENKIALDFGCGTGRNITNLHRMAFWKRVDGVDISKDNIDLATKILIARNITEWGLYTNNGVDLQDLKSDEYDFVMSTIVLQHIAVYDIRFGLLKEIYRCMKKGAIFSFQMGFGDSEYAKADYYDNHYDAKGTNSKHDVKVTDPKQITNDLDKIGFTAHNYIVRPSFSDGHDNWIFVTAIK